jgi:hypothetical protein
MFNVILFIRSATGEPLADGSIIGVLRRQGVTIHSSDVTHEGMTVLCKGEVRTLRLCAAQLASLSFVAGVSMQRYDDASA